MHTKMSSPTVPPNRREAGRKEGERRVACLSRNILERGRTETGCLFIYNRKVPSLPPEKLGTFSSSRDQIFLLLPLRHRLQKLGLGREGEERESMLLQLLLRQETEAMNTHEQPCHGRHTYVDTCHAITRLLSLLLFLFSFLSSSFLPSFAFLLPSFLPSSHSEHVRGEDASPSLSFLSHRRFSD